MNRRVLAYSLFLLVIARPAFAGEIKRDTFRAADGVNIVYDVRGKGDTALVFIHGWTMDRQSWKHQLDAFADEYRVVALDLAGHSESGKDRAKWSIAGLADDVAGLIKKLELKRVIFVGHSMGGPVSLMTAKRVPENVIGIVGVDTLHNVEFKFPEEVSKKFMAGFEKDFKGTLRAAMKGMLPAKVDEKLVTWITEMSEKQDPKMAVGLMNDMSRLDLKAAMKEAGKPIRAINAAPETPFAIPTDLEVNRKYADFDAVIMKGVGHFPMLERPDEFNMKLRQVLKELSAKK